MSTPNPTVDFEREANSAYVNLLGKTDKIAYSKDLTVANKGIVVIDYNENNVPIGVEIGYADTTSVQPDWRESQWLEQWLELARNKG